MIFSFENIGKSNQILQQGEFFKENRFVSMAVGAEAPKIIQDYKKDDGQSDEDHLKKIDLHEHSEEKDKNNDGEKESDDQLTQKDFEHFSEQWKEAQKAIPDELKGNQNIKDAIQAAEKGAINLESFNSSIILIGDAFQKAYKHFQEKAANSNETKDTPEKTDKPKTFEKLLDQNPIVIDGALKILLTEKIGKDLTDALATEFPTTEKDSKRAALLTRTYNLLRESKGGLSDSLKTEAPWLENFTKKDGEIDSKKMPELIINIELLTAGENEQAAMTRNEEALEKAVNDSTILQLISTFFPGGAELIKEWLMQSDGVGSFLRTSLGINISQEDLDAKKENDDLFKKMLDNKNSLATAIEKNYETKSKDLNLPEPLKEFFTGPLSEFTKRLPEQHEQHRTGNLLHDVSGRFKGQIPVDKNPFSDFKLPTDDNAGTLTIRANTPLGATGIAYFYESESNFNIKDIFTSLKGGMENKDQIIESAKNAAIAGQRYPDSQQGLPDTIYTKVSGDQVTLQWHKSSIVERTTDIIQKQKAGKLSTAGNKPNNKEEQ